MMYTCGYCPEGARTLEQAQQTKIDHVCRKIRLARGESFIDIGCGFGGFMFRAWETVGAIGTGLKTTTEQVDWLRGLHTESVIQDVDIPIARAASSRSIPKATSHRTNLAKPTPWRNTRL